MIPADPDRLTKDAFALRMKSQGINKRWEQMPDYAQDYWRGWIRDVRPAFEEEMRAAEVAG
jgi:hypothetical protein